MANTYIFFWRETRSCQQAQNYFVNSNTNVLIGRLGSYMFLANSIPDIDPTVSDPDSTDCAFF